MTKLTKKDYFKMVASVIENSNVENKAELQGFISHELELLEKKSVNRGTTETAKTKENNAIIEVIYNALIKLDRPVTITELQTEVAELTDYTNQKISALMKKLVDSNKVVKVVDKKKSYFKIAE